MASSLRESQVEARAGLRHGAAVELVVPQVAVGHAFVAGADRAHWASRAGVSPAGAGSVVRARWARSRRSSGMWL